MVCRLQVGLCFTQQKIIYKTNPTGDVSGGTAANFSYYKHPHCPKKKSLIRIMIKAAFVTELLN